MHEMDILQLYSVWSVSTCRILWRTVSATWMWSSLPPEVTSSWTLLTS